MPYLNVTENTDETLTINYYFSKSKVKDINAFATVDLIDAQKLKTAKEVDTKKIDFHKLDSHYHSLMYVTNDKILKGMEVTTQYFHSSSEEPPQYMNANLRY